MSLRIDRRDLLRGMAATLLGTTLDRGVGMAQPTGPLMRTIPSSGEAVPAVGLGSWITFNVGRDELLRDECAAVMDAFFADGGRLIDSSPMYGSSQSVIGYGLRKLGRQASVFSADKVWTSSAARGPTQIEESRAHWGVERFDLLQVHNLVAWQQHLATLLEMKETGRVRYVGITTSEGRRAREVVRIMRSQPIDFVQITYNPVDREVEAEILPLALERGIGVIVNRPFQQDALTRRLAPVPLPHWARDVGAQSWAQLILKFILAHPAVTCVIPATTRVDHVRENVAAASHPLPDRGMRERIAAAINDI